MTTNAYVPISKMVVTDANGTEWTLTGFVGAATLRLSPLITRGRAIPSGPAIIHENDKIIGFTVDMGISHDEVLDHFLPAPVSCGHLEWAAATEAMAAAAARSEEGK